jgi:RNA polymerase sigma factor (sigma-70 family)
VFQTFAAHASNIAEGTGMAAERVSDLVLLSREYRPALMAFFLRRVHDRAEAEDLTQEVFVRLAAKTDQELDCGRSYVFQVASNLLKDRARRYKTKLDYLSSIGEIDALSVDTLDPFRISASKESISAMCAALGRLNELTRNIFVLYRLEGMAKTVIADAFGLSVSSIEKHITRATVYLTQSFGDEL